MVLTSTIPSSSDKPPEKQKPLERAKVTYPYTAENDDELTIAVDDIVEIVNKDSGQEGWWKVGSFFSPWPILLVT